jgi:hypothetical protein
MQKQRNRRKMVQKIVQSAQKRCNFDRSFGVIFVAAEKWYRTGAVATETGISRYRIRALAKEGLIESRSSNGMLYIPASAVERLKADGAPSMPARGVHEQPEAQTNDVPDDEDIHALTSPRRTVPRTRITEELYAEPSRQLAKSKERVIRLEHSVEAKRLQQQSREIDRLAEEERAREQETRAVKEWRDGNIRRVLERVPGDLFAQASAQVEALLDRVPPRSNVTAKVDEIIHIALRPIRRREEQARAVEQAISQLRARARRSEVESQTRSQVMRAVLQLPEYAGYADMCSTARAIVGAANAALDHAENIKRYLSGLQLPVGFRAEDREDATELAHRALHALPQGASDRQFKDAIQNAIAPVVRRIEARNAQEERDRLARNHRLRIDAKVTFLYVPLGATSDERETAKRRVRAALEQLPATASYAEVEAETARQLAPIKAAIQARQEAERAARATQEAARQKTAEAERRADAALSSVESYLNEYFDFDSPFGAYNEARELKDRLRPTLIQMIQGGKLLNEAHVERWLRQQVENS